MPRQTKIVTTLGPATDRPGVLDAMIRAGVDVVRLNFSHGSAADHAARASAVRKAAQAAGRDVAILADLQGPKIRIGAFDEGPIQLQSGDRFTLDVGLADAAGTRERVGCTYTALPGDVKPGDTLLLNDGLISLRVTGVDGTCVESEVLIGGELSDHKGINRLGGGLSAPALTDKDRADIRTAAELDVDYLAVSFPRSAADMEQARALLREASGQGQLLAKIERAEALDHLDDIVRASDAVMVARGDLGVEIGDAELPGVQKRIISISRELNRLVITATQMLESMIHNPIPTRAEVLDVANAVMDGTDAVMLSAESAVGAYPVKAVEAMVRVCLGAERQRSTERSRELVDTHFARTDEGIAMATMYTARHMRANAILALTESGSTALWMSRQISDIPIYALTRHERTRRRMTLCRGVYPVGYDASMTEAVPSPHEALACLQRHGLLKAGDRVILTHGDAGVPGGTNTLKVLTVS
ncbi:MAG: pyruvate kinase [Nevskiales bacterium]